MVWFVSYVVTHWRGKLPLRVTLWVNNIGLHIALSYTEILILSQLTFNIPRLLSMTLVSLFITRLIVFPWQLIGLFRAIDYDFVENRNPIKTRGLQGFAVLTVLFTLVYSLEVIQNAIFYIRQVEVFSKPSAQVGYRLEVNKEQLTIRGGLDIGITNAVRSLIQAQPQIATVVLQSGGGQIYEGRGLARLFSDIGLDTYVYDECSSACVTAFIGGHRRHIGVAGKLGFHQYQVRATATSHFAPFYDIRAEQRRDLALFKSHGVRQAFLDKMFNQPASQIWYPEHKTLHDSNIIHFIIPMQDQSLQANESSCAYYPCPG
jgi:hypothetical protein